MSVAPMITTRPRHAVRFGMGWVQGDGQGRCSPSTFAGDRGAEVGEQVDVAAHLGGQVDRRLGLPASPGGAQGHHDAAAEQAGQRVVGRHAQSGGQWAATIDAHSSVARRLMAFSTSFESMIAMRSDSCSGWR